MDGIVRKLLINMVVACIAVFVGSKASAQVVAPELLNLLRLDTSKRVVAFELPKASVTLTPNPVFNNASLIVQSEETGPIACLLYDAEGRNVRSFQFKKDRQFLQQILPMYDLPKGEYLLNIVGKNILESRKIVKQ